MNGKTAAGLVMLVVGIACALYGANYMQSLGSQFDARVGISDYAGQILLGAGSLIALIGLALATQGYYPATLIILFGPGPIAIVVLQILMGGIFIYAGYVKLAEPWQLFAAGIADYEVVPMWAAKFLAHTLPWFEVLIGLLLIAGRWFRTSTVSTSLLLLVFFSLMVRAFAGGKEINCGCFGPNEPISWKTLVRDGSMLGVSLFLAAIAFRNRRTPA